MKVYGNLSLNQGNTIKGYNLEMLDADPEIFTPGSLWFNTTMSKIRYFDGVSTQSVSQFNDPGVMQKSLITLMDTNGNTDLNTNTGKVIPFNNLRVLHDPDNQGCFEHVPNVGVKILKDAMYTLSYNVSWASSKTWRSVKTRVRTNVDNVLSVLSDTTHYACGHYNGTNMISITPYFFSAGTILDLHAKRAGNNKSVLSIARQSTFTIKQL